MQTESHDGTAYQPQAEMVYNGLGQRQSMIAHAGGLSLATTYVLDSEQNAAPLMATANGQTTYYLYGLEPVAERAASWNYYLRDGLGSVRKLADSTGEIVLERSYTPWGDVLSQSGTLTPAHGYLGGWVDTATGLIYVGNGQYYDPATGRFLTRDAQPGNLNPYLPGRGDPTGLLIGPLALLVLVRRKKGGKANLFLVALVVVVLVGGMTVTACTSPIDDKPPKTPTQPTSGNTGTPTPTGQQNGNVTTTIQPPLETLTPRAPACPTPTPALEERFQITADEIALAGGTMMKYYIKEAKEDPALLAARIAMGESPLDLGERIRILWLIQTRIVLGFTNSNSRNKQTWIWDHFGLPSSLQAELLDDPNQFAVVGASLDIKDPPTEPQGHIRTMVYPEGETEIAAFNATYVQAQLINGATEETLKTNSDGYLISIKGYDEYRAFDEAKKDNSFFDDRSGSYIRTSKWNGGKQSDWISGSPEKGQEGTRNVWFDVYPMDNVFFGLITCAYEKQLVDAGALSMQFRKEDVEDVACPVP